MSTTARQILLIRFGALGDLCLLAGAAARFRASRAGSGCRVTLATKAAFAPLMETARGIDEVIALEGSGLGALRRLAARIDSRRWDAVVDAHHILRSGLLLGLLGRRPDARLAKDTAARLAFMKSGVPARSLDRSLSDRYDELWQDLDLPGNAAGMPDSAGEFAFGTSRTSRTSGDADEPMLGLAPGAQWPSKQWPEECFAELLTGFRARSSARVRIFLGPREEEWFAGSRLEAAAAVTAGVEFARGLPLTDIAPRLAACSRLVTNDSGLLHLAEAAGVPVVAFFGPTVREFGYFPRLPESRVLETPLECRPCSRNGKRDCHRGDLACLRRIGVDEALEAVFETGDWPTAGVGEKGARR